MKPLECVKPAPGRKLCGVACTREPKHRASLGLSNLDAKQLIAFLRKMRYVFGVRAS